MTSTEPQAPVAIVTGAASGIGLATARLLSTDGWRVVAADVADDLGKGLDAPDDRLVLQHTDISIVADVERLFRTTLDRFGRLDGVANVAGISFLHDVRLEDLDVDLFDRTHAVNMRGTFLMCRQAVPALRATGGGAIVNLGSVASLRGVGGAGYVSSKAGIAGLSRAIAAQYAAEGIRCTTVAPGPTSTPMLEISKQKASVSLGSPGTIPGEADPGEVAALIAFLLSERGRFMTGSVYTIDGGVTQH